MYKRADRLMLNEWGTLAFTDLAVANLRIGRINSNLKKKRDFSVWSRLESWEIYLAILSK